MGGQAPWLKPPKTLILSTFLTMPETHEKLAKILRADPEVLLDLDKKMSEITGKTGIMDKIIEENRVLLSRTIEELGIGREKYRAKDVYDILIKRLKHMDEHLYNFLGKPDLSQMSGVCGKLCETALLLNNPQKGFFIKKEKAVEMLEKFPPENLLNFFGYKSAGELVDKEGFSSAFSALRFVQDAKWMHKFFDEAYNDLTADDFEEREIELKVLELKWLEVAEKYLEKKYHNISHLKEFGVIFVIPLEIDVEGETLRLFTLILHYLNEVPFYSKLFKKFADERNFPEKLKSLLRGDVPDEQSARRLALSDKLMWLITQRYLAKDNKNDSRLFMPHVNPEAEHWYKAEGDLAKISALAGAEGHAFGYWQGLDFVGDFFQNGMGGGDFGGELVSFDLIDLTMSLVEKERGKFLYHQQEALWNKIFIEYIGRNEMNRLIEDNIISGFINL